MIKIPNSSRLSYRLLTQDDADLLFELDQDPDVMRFISDGIPTTMQEITDFYLPRMARYTDHDNGFGLWKVTLNEDDSYIGWILVRPMQFILKSAAIDEIELGWRLKKEAWGNGYATEAAKHIAKCLAVNPSIKHYVAIADEKNKASTRVMEKIGMKFIRRECFDDPLMPDDMLLFSLSKELLI